MGIYIKSMEMPKDGCHHMICIYADGTVSTGGREYTAVLVPPHGRLIDADALSERIEEQRNTEYAMNNRPHVTWKRVLELPLDIISDAPTIIEAEEDEA